MLERAASIESVAGGVPAIVEEGIRVISGLLAVRKVVAEGVGLRSFVFLVAATVEVRIKKGMWPPPLRLPGIEVMLNRVPSGYCDVRVGFEIPFRVQYPVRPGLVLDCAPPLVLPGFRLVLRRREMVRCIVDVLGRVCARVARIVTGVEPVAFGFRPPDFDEFEERVDQRRIQGKGT